MADFSKTYCNPLPLPNYPGGAFVKTPRDQRRLEDGWMRARAGDYRETADPSVIYYKGRWYLYPSCGMAYVSDNFVSWKHCPTEPQNVGYAPTVVHFQDKFYLTACRAPLYVSDGPLGPFEELGPMKLPNGKHLEDPPWDDPMLFADDDGALYAYWGLNGKGIFGASLDCDEPQKLTCEPQRLFGYDKNHEWERRGEFHEDASISYIEGPWMNKLGGKYYLSYAGPGTEWRTYAMGVYVADKPLGPFRYQDRNPILQTSHGMVHGPGHGCLVEGPNKTLWAFYTCLVRNEYRFERRIGMDPAGIDGKGNLYVSGASQTPQWAPGTKDRPELGNDAGLLPITVNKSIRASTEVPGRDALYGVDNYMTTWWQAEAKDPKPTLEVDLGALFDISAMRLHWKEPSLNYLEGIGPGPVGYILEVDDGSGWKTTLDRSKNGEDWLLDYRTFPAQPARRARLKITRLPKGHAAGLIDWTLFGGVGR